MPDAYPFRYPQHRIPFMFKKSLVISFALAVVIAGCGAEPSPAEIAADASSSVVRVETSTRSGDIFGYGSGLLSQALKGLS